LKTGRQLELTIEQQRVAEAEPRAKQAGEKTKAHSKDLRWEGEV